MKFWIAERRREFYWQLRGIEGQKSSKMIFDNREGEEWVAKVVRTIELNRMGNEGSGADNQVVIETIKPSGGGWG